MDFSGIHIYEILVSGLVPFVIGFFWYGSLFGKSWQNLTGNSEPPTGKEMIKMYGLSYVLTLFIAFFLSFIVEVSMMLGTSALFGGIFAVIICLGLVATTFGINYLFAKRSIKLYLIDVGYFMVTFFVIGIIIAAWR